jgi:thioester reductase-like protein
MKSVFMTGATGFLGREVLVRLLEKGARVLVTTRRRSHESGDDARARLVEVIQRTSSEAARATDRLTVAFADVAEEDLALAPEAAKWLDESSDPIQVVHGAAEVRFDLPWTVMHKMNVAGTANVIALSARLAEKGRLQRLDHISTTFIAGDRTDLALETEIDIGQRPRNSYERSKLEAEKVIAKARGEGLPITVHRPSIIVGDSRTGRASSFKVLYWPMKVYARGRWRTMFGRPDCTLDVVPVDFVADAMIALLDDPSALHKTVHLAAGRERQSTIGEVVEIAEAIFERGRVRYVDPDLYMKWLRPIVRPILALIRPDVAERGGVYLPYFRSNPSFSVAQASALLEKHRLEPPAVRDYFGRIVAFAKITDFGRMDAPLELSAGAATSPTSRRTGS